MSKQCDCLRPTHFGLAFGVVGGLFTFVFGLLAFFFGYGTSYVEFLGNVYLGFAASFFGSIIGFIWGFIYSFVMGYLIAWFYNFFAGRGSSEV
jgi:hypothetical protein